MNDPGRYGIWISRTMWPDDPNQVAAAAQELETLGFGTVWIGGSPPDDLELAEGILAATDRLVVGTSIVDIWTSDGDALAASHVRLREQFPGRFYLGVGSGHAPTAEALGELYVKPLSRLREFLTEKLRDVPTEERMIAALGPKALEAARDLTAGALPYLMPPRHTADARGILGPDRLLVAEQKVFLGDEAGEARTAARRVLGHYLSLPNYTRTLRRYGLTDEDLAGDGSDRFVDQGVVWGADATVAAGIEAHLEAGADQVAIQIVAADPEPHLPLAEWRRLAGILRDGG